MPFSVHVQDSFRRKVSAVAKDMKDWEVSNSIPDKEAALIKKNIKAFPHAAKRKDFLVAGVDGSGDYPSLSYADSCVYVASAVGTMFRTSDTYGLDEIPVLAEPVLEVVWLPGDRSIAAGKWNDAFEALAGISLADAIGLSDYRTIKKMLIGDSSSVADIATALIRPAGSDTSNVAIQLRSTAELGAALRLITSGQKPRFVINDTTFSLPMVKTRKESLFYEHLKRLCCVEANKRDITFAALSKSHGTRSMDLVESYARDALGLASEKTAEHWFLRLPIEGVDSWSFTPVSGRAVPPPGAVTYLFRLHRNTPIMRLDIDRSWWETRLRGAPSKEISMFADLDYCSHDHRAYGYPYPVKACHDRVRLSDDERVALKKIIMDAANTAGIPRHAFRDVSMATGHS
jgi:hypothetical protein